MRILFDARVTAPDGIGRYTRNLAHHLTIGSKKLDDTLTLLVRDDQIPAPQPLFDTSLHYTVKELQFMWESVQITSPHVFHCTDYRVPLPRTEVPLVVSIHDIFRVTHPSLCYDDEQFALRYGAHAVFKLAEVTNILAKAVGTKAFNASLHKQYCELMLRWAILCADVILVPTLVVRTQLLNTFSINCPILVIPYGINHIDDPIEINEGRSDMSTITNKDEFPFFLYVGQARAHKNIRLLLRVFRELTLQESRVRLVLVGKAFERNLHVHQLVEQSGLEKKVSLIGYLNDSQLATLYRRARALVHLSGHEGFGLTPLEALTHGAPIIVADTPVARETLNGFASFVSLNDEHSIVETLLKHLRPGHEAIRREDRIKWVEQYQWERTAQLTREAYDLAVKLFREGKRATSSQ